MHERGTVLEVGIKSPRHRLGWFIRLVGEGEEIPITDRGRPVAKITGADAPPALDRLIARGVVTPPREPGTLKEVDRLIRTRGSVSGLVAEQRR